MRVSALYLADNFSRSKAIVSKIDGMSMMC
ncbi:Uncharacterised protein [Vibrio cholerae]|nr:Uncharacterised protein [Vibrio cholerae]